MDLSQPRLKLCAIAVFCAVLAGCGSDLGAHIDREPVDSTQFDTIACPQLVAQRNALVARYGTSEQSKEKPGINTFLHAQPTGLIPVPDMRSHQTREKMKVLGKIDAMDDSIRRRACLGPDKTHARKKGL